MPFCLYKHLIFSLFPCVLSSFNYSPPVIFVLYIFMEKYFKKRFRLCINAFTQMSLLPSLLLRTSQQCEIVHMAMTKPQKEEQVIYV